MGGARIVAATSLTVMVAVAALVAGCNPAPDGQAKGNAPAAGQSPSGDPDRQGPAPLWSRKVATGEHWVGAFKEVVVLTDEGSIFGVEFSSGKELWRHDLAKRYSVADDLIVLTRTPGAVEVINASDGRTVWKKDVPDKNVQVYKRAVYTDNCDNRAANAPGACRITAYDVRDGRVLWTAPASIGGAAWNEIGPHAPVAMDSGQYVVAGIGASGKRYGAIDEKTGQALPGRSPAAQWAIFAVGTLLVYTDHDPPAGDPNCTVKIVAIEARTGATAYTGAVYSGRKKDRTCDKSLAGRNVEDIIGFQSRIAAVTQTGLPQVFELLTGRTVWTGDTAGVPIDSAGNHLLVRQHAETGDIAMLDFATGRKLWSAPDPGLEGSSASWDTAINSGLVAVSCGIGKDRACVAVYDTVSGKQLGRFPGWLVGSGLNWVAVSHSDPESVNSLKLDFIHFKR